MEPTPPPQTILVVDDDPLQAWPVACALASRGHRPILREGPREGLAFLNEHRADFVLTDLRMPEMDGLALARAARSIRPEVEVILLTGDQTPGLGAAAVQAGIFKVLHKPVDLSQLCQLIESHPRPELHSSERIVRSGPRRS